LKDNITGSWYQTVFVLGLALLAAFYVIGQYEVRPLTTAIIVAGWIVGIVLVVYGELRHRHSSLSRWIKNNLFTSVSNTLLTLLVVLVIASALDGFWQWGIVNASFDPEETLPNLRPEDGATWGVIWGARKLLMTGILAAEHNWRVWSAVGFIGAMWLLTFIFNRPAIKERMRIFRNILNGIWLLSPVILYIFLAGVPKTSYNLFNALTGMAVIVALYALLWWQKVIPFGWVGLITTVLAWPVLYTIWWAVGISEFFPPINVDNWGGLLLTLIIASSVIVLSLPLGMVLALARRSDVFGIPAWIIWPAAIIATIWGFTTTPALLETSRNTLERIISFWPVLILAVAYLIHRVFKGNIVAGGSTAFIELVRSVPLITLLFMGIVMAPFFLPAGTSIAKPWPIIVGYTLFASAYSAETIRGGLQAIPKGQYEAADSLGFNGLQKMRFIILPQALRIVIPAIVGEFIGAFKSSSLVSIVGLFDFMGINRAISSNPQWLGLRIELYIFMALVYFTGSFVMSSYSRRLETRLDVGAR
jgi:general L-amino acid transport system permease protein